MRKGISFSISLLLILVGPLTGCQCGLPESPGAMPSPELIAEPVQITWFLSSSDELRAVAVAFVDAFNESQDKVELVLDAVHSSERNQRIDNMLQTGDFPDIVGPQSLDNRLVQRSDLLAGQEATLMGYFDDIDPDLLELWQARGEVIGVPFGIVPAVLFYNADLFDAAGTGQMESTPLRGR